MKQIIDGMNMTVAEFSKWIDIPYNTVRQWYNGERTPAPWIVNLIKEKIERNKCGKQLTLFP